MTSTFNLQQVIEHIRADIDDTSLFNICVKVLVYVVNYPAGKLSYITYGSLRKVIGTDYRDEQLLLSIQYLCGDRASILNMKFELIDGSDTYIIPNEDVSSARTTGILIHPDKGERIDKYEEKLVIFFEPSSFARGIVS